MRKILIAAFALLIHHIVLADVRPAKIFADSMVLQRGAAIPVWGWADKGEKIDVVFNHQTKSVTTGADGKWKIVLEPEKAGGPYQLSLKGKNNVLIKDILVGDVWICSGQSNMEFTVNNVVNSAAEIATAAYPQIRHVKIANKVAGIPLDDLTAAVQWHSANPSQVGNFTAVGYFFARELFEQLQVPIGLINSSWGGTNSETWTSREAMESMAEFKELMAGIPSLNLDSMAAEKEKTILKRVEKLQGKLTDPSQSKSWSDRSFDDHDWPKMQVPGLWEQQSLGDMDGVVWLQYSFVLTAAEAADKAELYLGMIDDNDITYLNGRKLGSTNGYNIKRRYPIEAGSLHEGRNVISVRVEDTGGGGGFYGEASEMYLLLNNGNKKNLGGEWKFQVEKIAAGSSIGPNNLPSLLFNAMIHPLLPLRIKGAIWYQGESNAGRAYQYRKAFPLMITDWRNNWKQGDFPFYFVQLASFNSANGNSQHGSTWAELREAQSLTLSLHKTGMAVTTDIGESKDIHPKNKQEVGKRLAAIALHNDYGKTNIVYSGPVYQSMKVEGNKAVLSFTSRGHGLINHKPGPQDMMDVPIKGKSAEFSDKAKQITEGFEIAGADGVFYPAIANIEGDFVVVTSNNVTAPVAVRYGWADDAGNARLFNVDGFPASPFRTDQWKGITESGKYTIVL